MDISVYFEPIQLDGYYLSEKTKRKQLGNVVRAYIQPNDFPDLEETDIAILGIPEDRNAVANAGCGTAPEEVRTQLYKLFQGGYNVRMVDLGNMLGGNTIQDTYFALATTLTELIKNDIVPIIVGGSQDLTFAFYQAYEKLGRIVNIAAIDPQFDLGHSEEEMNSQSYLSKIILHQPNYLFNYTNIGYQTYFVDQEAIALMKNLFFDSYRLGMVRENIEEVEPMVRNADMLSVDVTAIRMSDAPGNANAIPNGFYGEEMCQIMRYAGMSDKLSALGIFEYNPKLDRHSQTSQLIAQMIWYFIDGYYSRKQDFPSDKKKDFMKFTVTLKEFKDHIIFYKSRKSDRWWMEVPIKARLKTRYERHHMVPCSHKDYKTACRNTIPDRWWQTYQKLM
jgi:formiminoglutamase